MAMIIQGRDSDATPRDILVTADGRLVVSGVSGGTGGGDGSDRELVVSTYRCKTAFTGASVGDTITATQIIDVTSTATTVSTLWRNQTTAADLASAPSAANLELAGSTALTDAQLRASAVAVSVTSLPLPADAATATLQTAGNTSLSNIDSDLGAQADAVATTDTGTFSVIALVKRGLTNWTTLLARIPALVSGRLPVDGSGVTQPVSGSVSVSNFPATQAVTGPLTDAQLRATPVPVSGTFFQATQPVSAASLPLPSGAATETTLAALNTKIPSQAITGLLPVDTLGALGTLRVQNTTGTAASIVLTSTTRRVSVTASQACVISSSTTASVPGSGATLANAIVLQAGETKDFDVSASTTLSVIRLHATDGTVYVTELL